MGFTNLQEKLEEDFSVTFHFLPLQKCIFQNLESLRMQNAQGTISSAILFFKFQAQKKVFCIKIHYSKEEMLKCPTPNLESNLVKSLTRKTKHIRD